MFEKEHTSVWDDKYKIEYKLTTTSCGFGKEGIVGKEVIISEGQVGGWYITSLFVKILKDISERKNKNPELDRFMEKIGAIEELLGLFELTWRHDKTVKEWMEDFNKEIN